MPKLDIDYKTRQAAFDEAKRHDPRHTPGPWKWQGEDYRGGWGWQMLVGPDGEGIIVGQGRDGGISPHIRAGMPLDPALCITGLEAHGKDHAECVHVFRRANACMIAAAPELLDIAKEAAEEPCTTKALEDLEPGCCRSCRARAAIAKANGDAS